MTEFDGFYAGRRVLVTGDTGFKGSWLALWLSELGAEVVGIALPPPDDRPSNFDLSRVQSRIRHADVDIRDREAVSAVVTKHRPDVVFHLAAQALVPISYEDPVDTFAVNVMGTVNVLDAARRSSVSALVAITSDKCYRNNEWLWGYRETDVLGGGDPYSASKACAELAIAAYRESMEAMWLTESPAIASARAGNVIGGGDWSRGRLVPDIVRALTSERPLVLRNAASTRPWQHVLEPLSGYLWLARLLATGNEVYRDAWNFGPLPGKPATAGEVVKRFLGYWGSENVPVVSPSGPGGHGEAGLLQLDATKAREILGWRTVWGLDETLEAVAAWYRVLCIDGHEDLQDVTCAQIRRYMERARGTEAAWARDHA